MILNPYRFSAAADVTLPLHWWVLDDDNTWADQGTGAWANLTEESPSGVPSTTTVTTTTSTVGTVSRTVCDLGDPIPHRLTGGSHAWDGASDNISMSIWFLRDSVRTVNTYMAWRNIGFPRISQLTTQSLAHYSQLWDAGNDQVIDDDTGSQGLSTWTHLAYTWDGTTMRIYTDGTEIGTATNASVGALSTSSMPFRIGGLTTDANNHDGLLAMAGIWDVALSTDEIAALWNSGDGANYSELWT